MRKKGKRLRAALCLVTLTFLSRVELKPESACKGRPRSHLLRADGKWCGLEFHRSHGGEVRTRELAGGATRGGSTGGQPWDLEGEGHTVQTFLLSRL